MDNVDPISIICPKYGRFQSLLACNIVGSCRNLAKCSLSFGIDRLNKSMMEYAKQHSDKYVIGGRLAQTKDKTKNKTTPLILIPKSVKIRKNFKPQQDDEIIEMSEKELMELIDADKIQISRLDNYNIIQSTKYARKVVLTLKKIERN